MPMAFEEFVKKMEEQSGLLEGRLRSVAKQATLRAIEKATELTPPTAGDLAGTDTRTGEMKQHWASDSVIEPKRVGGAYVTQLNNDKEYASYVNDGHWMDRHFVPGLVVNEESGLLEFNPDGKGGIVVGTQTDYVPGLFMVDEAIEVYSDVLEGLLETLIEELMEP